MGCGDLIGSSSLAGPFCGWLVSANRCEIAVTGVGLRLLNTATKSRSLEGLMILG